MEQKLSVSAIDAEFVTHTNQQWEIIKMYIDLSSGNLGDINIIVKRGDGIHPYAWGWYYNLSTGSWGQGHYDYKTIEDAEDDLLDAHPNCIEINDLEQLLPWIEKIIMVRKEVK